MQTAGARAGKVLVGASLDDGDIESFFDLTLGVDANFLPKFHDRVVVVPRGGGTNDVRISVQPK